MTKNIKQLIEELSYLPWHAEWHAYEGEECGISITIKRDGEATEHHFINQEIEENE